jgi:transposase
MGRMVQKLGFTHKKTLHATELEAVGARRLFLLPYSPDFSPIEPFWPKVQTSLNSRGARTYQALKEAIDFAYSQVPSEDIRNWFTMNHYGTSSEREPL